jgi:hypothetical protein
MIMGSIQPPPPSSPLQGGPTILADEPCASDASALADRVRGAVARHGWALVARALSDAEFDAVARRLGTIELRTDLFVDVARERERRAALGADADGRPVLNQAEGMDFHTDRPSAAWLAWRCVEPDATAGENQLIDAGDLVEYFTEDEIDGLSRVRVGHAIEGAGGTVSAVRYVPLVSRGGTGLQVYYVPWRLAPPADQAGVHLLERFVQYLRDKEQHHLLLIRLERGQCLFIDNHRMLHRRADLAPDSKRHLVRLMIRATR